jgi:alkylhydroperoxidase family enzyme
MGMIDELGRMMLPEPDPADGRAAPAATPRLAPVGPSQRTEEQHQLLSAIPREPTPNLFSTVAHHPALFRAWLPFCMQLLLHSAFPSREREMLIIRTASLCACAYELEHHLLLGAEAGLSEHDLAAITSDGFEALTPRERLLIAAADELHANTTILDDTWRDLSVFLTTEQLVELPMLVGHYILLAGTLKSLGVALDSEHAEPNTAL